MILYAVFGYHTTSSINCQVHLLKVNFWITDTEMRTSTIYGRTCDDKQWLANHDLILTHSQQTDVHENELPTRPWIERIRNAHTYVSMWVNYYRLVVAANPAPPYRAASCASLTVYTLCITFWSHSWYTTIISCIITEHRRSIRVSGSVWSAEAHEVFFHLKVSPLLWTEYRAEK